MIKKGRKENMWGSSKIIKKSWLHRGMAQVGQVTKHHQNPGTLDSVCEWAKTIYHPQREKIHRSRIRTQFFWKCSKVGTKHFDRVCEADTSLRSWAGSSYTFKEQRRKRQETYFSQGMSTMHTRNTWRDGLEFLFFRTVTKLGFYFDSQEYH